MHCAEAENSWAPRLEDALGFEAMLRRPPSLLLLVALVTWLSAGCWWNSTERKSVFSHSVKSKLTAAEKKKKSCSARKNFWPKVRKWKEIWTHYKKMMIWFFFHAINVIYEPVLDVKQTCFLTTVWLIFSKCIQVWNWTLLGITFVVDLNVLIKILRLLMINKALFGF